MRRLFLCFAMAAMLAGFTPAQEARKAEPEKQAASEEQPMTGWMWINFLILVAGLGYFLSKNVPPMLRARTGEIQGGIREGARLKAEAEAALAEVERRLQGIGSEINKLRLDLTSAMNTEGARLRDDTERQVTRVHNQAQQEIQFMTKTSRQELKAFSARLAIDLASEHVRQRMNPEIQHQLVDAFLADLRQNGDRGITTQ